MQVGYSKNAILDEYLASLHTGLQCCQPYESRSVKNKAATRDGRRRASSTHGGVRRPLFAQDDDENEVFAFVTGSTLYAGDKGRSTQPPGHNPLGHNPVFCCRRTSQDRTGGIFVEN